ncbi:MAG: Phenylalanyl-tRNA synthetase beta chain [Candidatus Ozemobacter sibiricus]|uniref:Phenylalanine--tRNA ligase beta subunit n=1 Tax=Candidatus Ozemobacter sibiricus TaxID=2268124 RepID=A0A367ZD96_9BACT|nr:MAG: Phenylalanyl-tRNA synthetase beta chain [Candidatus Ozemobacter sibiricus]
MNILLSWLRDYIDIQVPPLQIADALMMAGIEVEAIHEPGKHLQKVVVGRILTRAPHPNADKLSLCTVDVGQAAPLQIVCGAPNCDPGAKVPTALVGAVLPSGFEIRVARIRGVESAGMLCSRKELGLGDDHSGLYHLPPEAPVGEDIVKALGMDDVVFTIAITPNRGDALSHLGIARELSALFNLPLHRNSLDDARGDGDIREQTAVTLEEPALCPRYGARIVRDVTVGDSPRWLRERLEKIGIRSINNIVDITNYVMMDIGHPMHAFDLDKLAEQRIVVRRAAAGEKLHCLDGVTRALDPSMLVIADARRPVALAGVMGGEETGVTAATRHVLLEAACFDPVTVRKTAKALAMTTDSSYRFERGTNIDNVPIALNLAARLIRELAGGRPVGGLLDAYPAPPPLRRIMLRTRRVARVLGVDLKPAQIETLLLRLKFEVSREGETLWVGVPPFRHDIEQEADLIEEVARLYGYGNIPATLPTLFSQPVLPTPLQRLTGQVRTAMVDQGFHEIITYSFIPTTIHESLREGPPLAIRNPLSEDQGHLRTSLLWGMIDALTRNIFNDEYDLRFFEIGRVFRPDASGFAREADHLCLGCAGPANPADWRHSKEPFDLYRMKGLLGRLGHLLPVEFEFARGNHPALHPARQLEISCQNRRLGVVGQIHPRFRTNKKLPEEWFVGELDLSALSQLKPRKRLMQPIPAFPAIRRDLAILLPKTATFQDVERIVREAGGEILEKCALFDVYEGKGIDPDKRSLALELRFRAKDRTLKEEEVQPKLEAMISQIATTLGGKLRE